MTEEAAERRVLIVEDDGVIAAHLESTLARLKFEVAGIAASGEEALHLAAERGPALALMDIGLDGALDGIATAALLRERFALPVVYLTAHVDPDTLSRAKHTEPAGYLTKPFREGALLATLEMALHAAAVRRRLRESERRFEALVAGAPVGIFEADTYGEVRFANEAWNRLLRTPDGQPAVWLDAAVPGEEQLLRGAWSNAVSAGTSFRATANLRGGDAGGPRVDFWAAPQRDDAGRPSGYVGVAVDVTDRARREEGHLLAERQALRAQKAESLTVMAGGVAHLFNNILQGVTLNLEVARVLLIDQPEPLEMVQTSLDAALRAAKISGLLRTYLGDVQGHRRPLDLALLCREHLPALRTALPPGVRLAESLPLAGPRVLGGPAQLRHLLDCLLVNAAEAYAGRPGEVRLALEVVEPAALPPLEERLPANWAPRTPLLARLSVTDHGCGIAPPALQKIFDPFYTTKFTGRGLGLPSALGVVRGHEGGLAVRSELGSGSVFEVFLPVLAEGG
jgi:signal transduction histidine kinase